jgi:hypothetical protein
MKETFETNLEEATTTEDKATDDYAELKEAKGEELAAAEDALNKMDGENGAKAMSKEDSETERDALKTQIDNDNKYIEQTATDLETKKSRVEGPPAAPFRGDCCHRQGHRHSQQRRCPRYVQVLNEVAEFFLAVVVFIAVPKRHGGSRSCRENDRRQAPLQVGQEP